MELALLIFRLFLAAIFGVAGIAKLADPAGSRKAFAGFGVPASLSTVAVILLPIVELTIAIGLLFPVSSWYAAIGAVALLTVFVAGMIYQLARGKAPDCHCFGQLHSEPVGISSLIRNVLFLVPAIVLITKGRREQGLSLTNTR